MDHTFRTAQAALQVVNVPKPGSTGGMDIIIR